MAQRTALQSKRNRPSSALKAAAQAKDEPETEQRGGIRTAGVSLPVDAWELLTDVAVARKKRRGGRASLSAILVDLIERHRAELEAELR